VTQRWSHRKWLLLAPLIREIALSPFPCLCPLFEQSYSFLCGLVPMELRQIPSFLGRQTDGPFLFPLDQQNRDVSPTEIPPFSQLFFPHPLDPPWCCPQSVFLDCLDPAVVAFSSLAGSGPSCLRIFPPYRTPLVSFFPFRGPPVAAEETTSARTPPTETISPSSTSRFFSFPSMDGGVYPSTPPRSFDDGLSEAIDEHQPEKVSLFFIP